MNHRRIALLVHGSASSIEAVRARGITQAYPAEKIRYLWREQGRLGQAAAWHKELKDFQPEAIYVVNTALPGAPLACLWKWTRRIPFVLDTGDVIHEMARRSGITPAWKHPFLRLVEQTAQRNAQSIVVRGTAHKEYLEREQYRQVHVIHDGFHPGAEPAAEAVAAVKRKWGLENKFVAGVMGSLVFSPRLRICYGWDLIEALSHLRDLPVMGMIVGDGNGAGWLRERARHFGVMDRLVFCGRIPYPEVPLYLRTFDVALSTQTNNLPGQVRTTGKLPEYMAAERFILASKVGEAARLLPESMLIDFTGEVDSAYPRKLADRIRFLWSHRAQLEERKRLREIVEKNCSYEVLSRRFNQVIAALDSPPGPTQGSHQ